MSQLRDFIVEMRIGPPGVDDGWVDVTASVELTDAALDYEWGASGDFGDVAPSWFSFELFNNSGDFTPDNPAGIYYGRLLEGVAVRWRAAGYNEPVEGVRTRWALGDVAALEPVFPGDVAAWARVRVTVVDILARLERHELRDLLTEQTLLDGAFALWLLDDPQGSAAAAESSRYTVDPLRPAGNLAQIGWAAGRGIAYDGLSSLGLNADIEAARGWLTGALPVSNPLTGGYTMAECWFTITPEQIHTGVSETPILLHSTLGTGEIRVVYLTDAGRLRQNGSAAESKVVTDGQVHHVLYLYDPSINALVLECDGVSFSSPALGGATAQVVGPRINVGGFPPDVPMTGWANPVAWPGTISRVAVGSNVNRAAWRQHYTLGTVMQETTRQRIARLLSFAGATVPISALADYPVTDPLYGGDRWSTALANPAVTKFADTLVGPQETQGGSLLSALQDVMRLEGGRLWTQQVRNRSFLTAPSTPPSGSTIVFAGRGTFRPSTVALELFVERDLEGQPATDRSTSRQVAIATASSRTLAVTVADDTMRAKIGNVSASVDAPAAAEVELRFMANDRLAQTRVVKLRLNGLSINPALTPEAQRGGIYTSLRYGPLWASLLGLAHGDRVRVRGLPSKQLGFGQIDGYVIGGKERHDIEGGRFDLRLIAADLPAEFEWGSEVYGRIPSNGDLALQSPITASASSMSLAFSSLGLTTASGDYPLDLDVNGERVTVTGPPAGSTSPQTVAIVRGVGDTVARAHAAAEPVDVWLSPVIGWGS